MNRAAEVVRRATEAADYFFALDVGDYGEVVRRDEEVDRVDVEEGLDSMMEDELKNYFENSLPKVASPDFSKLRSVWLTAQKVSVILLWFDTVS